MSGDISTLDRLAASAAQELAPLEQRPGGSAPASMRELFLELLVISLGNLFGKTPVASSLYDRAMLRTVIEGLEDADITRLTRSGEDWLRLEGIVRSADGQKAYILNRPSLAVLSSVTPDGQLGEIMERIVRCYAEGKTTPALRQWTRELGAYFLSRVARS